jgi:Ca-activated chloride channel family protein
MGNYNDVLMEQLADKGDGRYAYVDTLDEARRLFVEELTGTLWTIGSEARAQVEFDRTVERYRLLGYENRDIADERFRDDTVDAGEIGAGHTVTALYELKLAPGADRNDRLAVLRLRYKSAATRRFEEIAHELRRSDLSRSWKSAPDRLRLAGVAAEFAEILRGAYWAKEGSLDHLRAEVDDLDRAWRRDDRVRELADLIDRAARLSPSHRDPRYEER